MLGSNESKGAKLWDDAACLAWRMQREGKTPPLTDLVIALSALRVRAMLISLDVHFDDIPALQVRKTWPLT